jgi:hypothetical protein
MRFVLVLLMFFGIFLYDFFDLLLGVNGLIFVWANVSLLLISGLLFGKLKIYKSAVFYFFFFLLCFATILFRVKGGVFWLSGPFLHLIYILLFVLLPWWIGKNVNYVWLNDCNEKLLKWGLVFLLFNVVFGAGILDSFRGISDSASGIRLGVTGNIVMLMGFRQKVPRWLQILSLIVGVTLIAISQTRSQALFAVFFLVYLSVRRPVTLIFIASFVVIYFNKTILLIKQLQITNRFMMVAQTGRNPREELYLESFRVIVRNPFGGTILLPGGVYPHNIILEGLMTFGVLGGVIFFGWVTYQLIKAQYKGFILLAIFTGFFSFSLITHPFLWFVLSISNHYESIIHSTKK